jgi:hypothetical protein
MALPLEKRSDGASVQTTSMSLASADEMKQDCEAPRGGWAAAGNVRQTRAWRISRAVARDIVVQDYGWNSIHVQ